MIRCIIIDDEPLAIQLLSSYIEKIDHLELTASFTNPLNAIPFIKENTVDLLFLDVEMPELNGLELASLIGEKVPVIFTTAYPNYAVEGFEVNAIDYIVKPITLERFLKAVKRVSEKIGEDRPRHKIVDPPYIFVKTEHRHQKINLDDILYFRGWGDYVVIQCKDKKIMTLEKLRQFEHSLPDSFIRIHKSYIISLNKIDFITKNRISIQNELIPIGATYKESIEKFLHK